MRRLLVAALWFAAACFNIDEPRCSFSCGPGGACPDDYTCAADGYCHLHGDTTPCNFSDAAVVPDLSTSPSPDQSIAPDLSVEPAPLDMSVSSQADL